MDWFLFDNGLRRERVNGETYILPIFFIYFTNQITLKPSLAQKLKLIFKFSAIKGQIIVPLWTHMGHKR